MSVLVSFDVDGTLIRSRGPNANQLHKEAFAAAFKQVLGLDTTIDVIPHHGSTDSLILVAVLEHHGISKKEAMDAVPELSKVMVTYFMDNLDRAGTGLEVLPGVCEVLAALSRDNRCQTCLVTGNLEPIGWAKMEALGIADLFSAPHFGGFGSDYCSGNTLESWRDRAELIRLAAQKAERQTGLKPERRLHIGDAPMDVQAAAEAGAVPVGVTTGVYTESQLRSAEPTSVIIDSLEDVDRILRLVNPREGA